MANAIRRIASHLGCALLLPTLVVAQERPALEVGTNVGVSILSANGTSVTTIGVPGQGILGQSTIYGTFFAGSGWMLEPQVALSVISSEGETVTSVSLGGQVGYLFNGSTSNSPFVAGNLAYQSFSGSGVSGNDVGLGGRVGYRVPIGGLGVRFEIGYRRWFDNDINEFSFGIGFGGIINKNK